MKKISSLFVCSLCMFVFVLVTGCSYSSSSPDSVFPPMPVEQVKDPEFSTGSGQVEFGRKISLICATDGAEIYFTTDGSDPAVSGVKYENPIEITVPLTIKALAKKIGMKDSNTVSAQYSIKNYVITFDSQSHGVKRDPKTVSSGYKLSSEDLQPLSEYGWVFLGWFIGESKVVENTPVNADMTITAKWKKCASSGISISYTQNSDITISLVDNFDGTFTFKVPSGYDKYEWSINPGLTEPVEGTESYSFTPEGTARYVIVLYAVKNNIHYCSQMYFKKS